MVTAAFETLPEDLTNQLGTCGILVTPLGYETISQRLWKIIRTAEGLEAKAELPVVFVPMVKGLPEAKRGFDDEQER
jgi:protein-L-isoaspartate O-methyltransferase